MDEDPALFKADKRSVIIRIALGVVALLVFAFLFWLLVIRS